MYVVSVKDMASHLNPDSPVDESWKTVDRPQMESKRVDKDSMINRMIELENHYPSGVEATFPAALRRKKYIADHEDWLALQNKKIEFRKQKFRDFKILALLDNEVIALHNMREISMSGYANKKFNKELREEDDVDE